MKVMIIVNVDWFFISHRLPIALAARNRGYSVSIAVGDTGRIDEIRAMGFEVHNIPVDRSGSDVIGLIRLFWSYFRLLRTTTPDVVHLVTIKPVLLGGIAARIAGVPGVLAAISGLGHVFVAEGFMGKIRRALVSIFYRIAFGKDNIRVIFQNPVDERRLRRLARLPPNKVVSIPGSGVDLEKYLVSPLPSPGPPVFVMASRLLVKKGVREFVAAAGLVKANGVGAEFWLVGEPDRGNLASIKSEELDSWKAEGLVQILGFRNDVASIMAAGHVVVLPSYYGEGLPKVLIEAAACGRAVITTDMPGCRDAIEAGVTGLLVSPRNAGALASAMAELAQDPARCARMGQAGRERAERIFDVRHVVDSHLHIYQELASRA